MELSRIVRRRRDVVVDAALGVAVALVISVAIAADVGGGYRNPDLVAYLFAVGLGALMLVRRQFPVLALIATSVGLLTYYAFGYPAIGLAIPVAAALYSAAEAGRLRWAIGAGVGLLVVSTGFRLAEGQDPAYLFGYELAATVGLMGAVIAIGDGICSRRLWRAGEQERLRQAERARERKAAQRVEAERLRIAREVHDVLAHSLAVVTLQADVAAEALPDDSAAAADAVGHIREAGGSALRDLRATVRLLREPAEQASPAPVAGLGDLDRLARATTDSGLATTVRIEGDPAPLPAVVDATAYRIVQESLTNALRHSGARTVEVALRYTDAQLSITVADDGRGSSADKARPDPTVTAGAGHGIAGMRERAALLGGEVRIGERQGGGFQFEASIPLAVHS